MVEWLRDNCPVKIGHMDKMTDEHMSDSNVPGMGGGGWGGGRGPTQHTNSQLNLQKKEKEYVNGETEDGEGAGVKWGATGDRVAKVGSSVR